MAAKRSGTNLTRAVAQSGHEIWLAGLGAFSTARKESNKLFEERLAKTLKGIGVPTARDVSQLSRRVAELDRHVAALTRGNGAKRARAKRR